MKYAKTASIFLAIIMLCTALVSCANKDGAPDGYKKISEDNIGYNLYVPTLWEESGPCGAIVGAGDPSKVSLMAFDAGDATSAEQCFEVYAKELLAQFPDLTYIEEGTDVKLGEHAAKQYIYTATVGGREFKFMQVIYFTYNQNFVISQPEAYIFTYTASADLYDSHIEDVIEIMRFVKFDGDEK